VREVEQFIAVNEYYRQHMARFLEIPLERIAVVPLGVHVDGYASEPRQRHDPFTVGFFARIAPEKGLHLLCDAYKRLRERSDGPPRARLVAAGYLGPEHKAYLASIEAQMKEWGLGGEFEYRGAPERDEKLRVLQSFDVCSVPATFPEAKGLSIIEAMGNAVPVVQPRAGAFPELVDRTGGGLLVPPDDPASLADALWRLWKDPGLAADLGRRGAHGVRAAFTADHMAAATAAVYETVLARAGGTRRSA
jgi:glycosyltransferase involved in cell wall biosynthesis